MKNVICLSVLLLLILHSAGCFGTYEANEQDPFKLAPGPYTTLSAKVFLKNNTYLLFSKGFEIHDSLIEGEAKLVSKGDVSFYELIYKVPFDSITAMVTYEETTSGIRYFGSVLYGITAPALMAIGIYCLSCPKCCFGSCPTIYTASEKDILQAELFSECISRQLEDDDLDMLSIKLPDDTLQLKITNEALETHYINKFEIVLAEHPKGTKLYPSISDQLLIFDKILPPSFAENKSGEDLSCLLVKDDEEYYRSGVDEVKSLKNGPSFDFIDLKIPVVGKDKIKMLMKYRNTLLSTTLLYDVVIGSQGIEAIDWQQKMNNDPQYASLFKLLYDTFSGINIKIFSNGMWQNAGRFNDAGPLNWKYISAEIPATGADTLLIRLEFIPDNFMIDYIGFNSSNFDSGMVSTKIISPSNIYDRNLNIKEDIPYYIKYSDDAYLVTEPGEQYTLSYNIGKAELNERTAFISSSGYYVEWVRGTWISVSSSENKFNLYDLQGTLSKLADSWIENSSFLEQEFFRARVISGGRQ